MSRADEECHSSLSVWPIVIGLIRAVIAYPSDSPNIARSVWVPPFPFLPAKFSVQSSAIIFHRRTAMTVAAMTRTIESRSQTLTRLVALAHVSAKYFWQRCAKFADGKAAR